MKKILLILSWLAFAGYAFATANVARDLSDPSQTTITSLGGVGRSASWTEEVGTTGENLWASSQRPAELTAAVIQSIRYIEVKHNDATDNTLPVCVRAGPVTDSPALSCAASIAANGAPLTAYGSAYTLTARMPSGETVVTNAYVPLWAIAQSGAVLVTVTVWW